MQINPTSPNFTGFVKFYDSKKGEYTTPVNTSQILGFESGADEKDGLYVNAVSYLDFQNKPQQIMNVHHIDEDSEHPYGNDFSEVFAKVCAEADKTGDILKIYI